MFTLMPTVVTFTLLENTFEKNEGELTFLFSDFMFSGREEEDGVELVDFTRSLEVQKTNLKGGIDEIAKKLEEANIPFDRKVTQGEVLLHEICCRVSFTGDVKVSEFDGNERTMVNLSSLITNGLKSGFREALGALSDNRSTMSWQNQYTQQIESDAALLSSKLTNSSEADKVIDCVIENPGNDEKTKCKISISKSGIAIGFEGYSDNLSDDQSGSPVYITHGDNGLSVLVYGSINEEDPTNIIELVGAKVSRRI